MTLVPSCVLVSPPSYRPSPRVDAPTTIDLHAANVPDAAAAVEVLVVVDTVLQMKEETSLASTIDGVNTGIFETSIIGPTVLVTAVRTLVTQTKTQHRMTNLQHQHLHHQTFIRSGNDVHASCSFPECTIDTRQSIIHGCENDDDGGRNLPTTSTIGFMVIAGLLRWSTMILTFPHMTNIMTSTILFIGMLLYLVMRRAPKQMYFLRLTPRK